MFCKNCGKELIEGAAFCSFCGTAVTMPKPEAAKPESTEQKAIFGEPEINAESTAPIYQMPQYTAPAEENKSDKKGFSIASLVLGIVSLLPCCCVNFITAILAVVFGIIGIKSSSKTLSVIGIILAAIGFILYLIVVIVYAFILETNTEDFSYFFNNNMYY